MGFLLEYFLELNSDLFTLSWNKTSWCMKPNIQISVEALNWPDRIYLLSAPIITTKSHFLFWSDRYKTLWVPKILQSFSLLPSAIWCLETRNISMFSAAKVVGRIWKKKLPATDKADQLLAGNCRLFLTMMTDCFNLTTHGCSASEPATDGNHAPFPLNARCSPYGSFLLMSDKQSLL